MGFQKRFFTRFLATLLAAVLLFPSVIPTALANEDGQLNRAAAGREFHDVIVSDTLRYGNMAWTTIGGRQESHFLIFSPGGDIRPMVSAGNQLFGASNINAVINHAQGRGHNVIGGINADFFSFQTGLAEGIYISNGRLKSSHHGRSAVFFREDGSAFVGNPSLSFSLQSQGQQVNFPFFNKFRQPHWFYLYDEHFAPTTQTSTPGREVVFRILGGRPAAGGSVHLEVTNIVSSSGAIPIPRGHMILSADQTNPNIGLLDQFSVGDRVTLRIGVNDPRITEAAWATGAGDILVSGGHRTSGWDAGVGGLHPRTALGIRPDGGVILYTVDGRQPGHSVGLSLSDLATELVALGATYVVNLDGGGSTTFSFRYPGTSATTVMNRPSGGALRNCATFILLTAPSGDGRPAHIQFSPNQATALGGSLIRGGDLYERITLTDRGYFPLNPAGLVYTVYEAPSALGQQEGNGFRTATGARSGRLTVEAENGARGHVYLNLITRPEGIEVRIGEGRVPSTFRLAPGDRVRLSYHALMENQEILSSMDAFETELTGLVATIDGSGLLTMIGNPGTRGSITVSAGGTNRTIDLVVARFFADTDNHWGEGYIGQLKNEGIVTGVSTERGTHFFPDQRITRAEFAAILSRFLDLDTDQYQLTGQEFLDDAQIPAWARPYVAAVFHGGYMTGRGVPGGVRFDANSHLSRAEAFTGVGRLFYAEAPPWLLGVFTDAADVPDWARAEIAKLIQEELLTGTPDGQLLPLRSISRAETAALLARLNPSILAAQPTPTPSPSPTPEPSPSPSPSPEPSPSPAPSPEPSPSPSPSPSPGDQEGEGDAQELRGEPAALPIQRLTGRRQDIAA